MRRLSGFIASAQSRLWSFDVTSTFDVGYASKDKKNQLRVDDALVTLSSSKQPQRLGDLKNTPDGYVLVYEIGRKYRLSYRVEYISRTIQLVRVCDHKTVYGKD